MEPVQLQKQLTFSVFQVKNNCDEFTLQMKNCTFFSGPVEIGNCLYFAKRISPGCSSGSLLSLVTYFSTLEVIFSIFKLSFSALFIILTPMNTKALLFNVC